MDLSSAHFILLELFHEIKLYGKEKCKDGAKTEKRERKFSRRKRNGHTTLKKDGTFIST